MKNAGFLVRTVFTVFFVCQAQCGEGGYTVTNYLRCSHLNVAEANNGGQCIDVSHDIDGCGAVLDNDTTSEWSGDGGVGQWLKIKFAREYLINTIRVMQKSTATDQIKGLRLEFSDGSETFVELTKNEASPSVWDVINFADVSTTTVKIEVDTVYTSTGINGFKEIEFYHNNCIRDKLCSRVELPGGKNSEIHSLFGNTISFGVSVGNAQGVSVTLHEKPQVDSARYRFSIGTGQLKLYRSGEGGSESSKESASKQSLLASQWQTTFWIDLRSSNLVLGSGGEILLQWNDPSPISVSYVSFTADSSKQTTFTLCNRPNKCYKDADHYWPLDKHVAATVYDLIGSKHGKVGAQTGLQMGPAYQGMRTTGLVLHSSKSKTTDFGDFCGDCVGDAALCDEGITVGLWVLVEDGVDSDILHTAESHTDRGIAIFYKTATSLLTVQIFSANEYGSVSVKIASQTYYHVFVSWEEGRPPWLVVNGVEQFYGTRLPTSRLEEKYTHLLAGVRPEGGESYARLSHVVIWKRGLSIEQMMAAFHCFELQSENSPCASIETDDRITCGWSGITEDDCKKLGCCYKDLTCFKPDGQSTNSKLGVSTGFSRLSASSHTTHFGAQKASLIWPGSSVSNIDVTTASNFAWKPRIPDNQWLQLDVYQVKRVTAVATQGLLRNSASSYCQTYTLYHSKSGAMWQAYEENNVEKVFAGNTDATNVVKHSITTPFDARFIRFYVKSWHNEPALKVEVYGETTAKNYIGCYAGGTFDVCGDYASDSLTPEICTTCCGLAGYRYSALRNGEQCLCSNTVDSNKRVGDPRCDDPCTGNIVLRCGGRDAYSIYEALGDYSFPFELTMPKNVSVYERINANFTSYSGASYTLDFGEDVVFNSDNASVSYLYHSTGQHNVYGHALLGEYGEAQMKSTSLAVDVCSSVMDFELNCPPAVEANQEFACLIKVHQGSNMHLEAHFTGGSAVATPIDDARSYLVGELFSIPAGSAPNQSTNKTVLIPSYRFEDDGKLMGWRICVETSGFVTLQIFRPVCGKGTYNSYCYLKGNCDADLTPCVNATTSSCTVNQVFSTAMGVCTDENITPANTPSVSLSTSYELITESHLFLSKPGCHIFHFDDVKNTTDVNEGDIVGFTYHGSGFAEITSRPSGNSKELNATGFSFSDLELSVGSILTTSENSPSVSASQLQYSLAAIHQVPSLFSFSHNYSIGQYHEEATVRGTRNAVKVTTHIVATESVDNVTWTTPKAVATNATYKITIHPHKGNNITYAVDFGAGGNQTIYKVSLDSDLQVSFVYNMSGHFNTFLYATNIISFVVKACTVVVQDVVFGLDFYGSIRPVPLGDGTIIQWIMRQGNGVNITIDFDDGSTFHNGSFDIAYLFAAMNNHTYAEIGEYTVTINVSNCVSNASIKDLAIVELPLDGVTLDVIHANRDIEVNETVTIQITVQQGTNPEFLIDFGDGTVTTTRELAVQHSYSSYDFYNVSISAYNNVSRENASKEIQVHKPVDPLVGFIVTCSLTNLTDLTRCMLNITQGTDFTCTWDWDDGSFSETRYEQLGNLTYHNYSVVGHYNVALNCTNRLYNTTSEKKLIVEVPIGGFMVADPIAKDFQVDFSVTWSTNQGTDANFTVTFTHVVSGMSYNATVTTSVDTTSGSAVITSAMMPDIGIYELEVTAVNHVTPCQTIRVPVLVDIPITDPSLTRPKKFVEVSTTADFSFQISAGSNVSLCWNFSDGSPAIYQYYQGRSFPSDGITIGHEYSADGEFIVNLFVNNSVSNFTRIISIYIQHPPNITLTTDSPQNIPPGTITFTIDALLGEEPPTNATYTVHFGDGTSSFNQLFSTPLVLEHNFPANGSYTMNITVTNDIKSAFLETDVELQTPIKDLVVTSVHNGPEQDKGKPGKGPEKTYFPCDFPVLFGTSIRNGTNVSYTWNFGDDKSVVTQNNFVNNSYPNPDRYVVTVVAENAVSRNSTTLTVDIQCMVKIKSFTNNGPAKLDVPIKFNVLLDQAGTDSCYVVNISDNGLMVFKRNPSKDCPEACTANVADVRDIPVPYTGFSWEHTYPDVGIYKLTITACNLVSKVIEPGEAACAAKPCKYPNVTMYPSLVGNSSLNAKVYFKLKPITIKNEIKIDCEATKETRFLWEVSHYFSHNQSYISVVLPESILLTDSRLNVPARGFPTYGVFRLRFTIFMHPVDGIYKSDVGFVEVLKSDIIAVMDGGMSKAVGQGKTTYMSCKETTDPDVEENNPSDFQYCWFCAKKGSYNSSLVDNCTQLTAYPVTPIAMSSLGNDTNNGTQINSTAFDNNGCFGYPPGRLNASTPEITLDTRMMVADSKYDVCVQVSKDTRKSVACGTLEMKAGDPPNVAIRCAKEKAPNCNRKINPSDKLALIGTATCETCTSYNVIYKWIILVRNTDVWEEVPDQTSLVNTPLTGSMLAVKPEVLTGGKWYKFRLEGRVINAGNVPGFSEWEKEVNEPPKHGKCEVTPQLGYAFSPDFKIGCTGWNDDTKLIYSVNVRLDCDAAELPVSPAVALSVGQSYNLTSITLPLGLAKHEYRVDVIITIKDEDDAATQRTVTVQVKMAEVSAEEQAAILDKEADKLETLLSEGDPDAALSVIGGIASALTSSSKDDENSDSDSKEKDEEQLKKEAEMKEKLVSAISSFPPPSNPEDALKQSGALAAVTSGPSSTLSADAKDKIAESVSKMSNVLDKPMSSQQRQSLASSLMGSIGAVLQTSGSSGSSDEAQSSNDSSTDTSAAQQQVLDVKNKILNSAAAALVAGEEFAVQNSVCSLKASKAFPKDVTDVAVGGSCVGNLGGAVGNDSSEPIQMQMSSFGGSPFGKGAGKVDSGVTELQVKNENGNPKNVSNLTSYMDIFIPAKGAIAESAFHLIAKGDMLVLKLEVTNNMSAIYVWAVPAHNNTKTNVLCRKGSEPTQTDYDFSQVIPKDPEQPKNGSAASCNDADSDADRYQLFIDNDDLNQTASGLWYCGFYYNESAQESSKDSAARRKRRETQEDDQESATEESIPEKNNLTITIFEVSCKYYDTKAKKWNYDGCKAGPKTTPTKRHCRCNHLTSFASDFFVPPNKIDWDKVSLEELLNNPLVFSVVCGIFGLYFLLVLWARRADRKDLEKVGVAPLPDNDPRDTYMYEVVVYTGFSSQAGTSSEVRMVLTGGLDETSPRRLKDTVPGRRKFCRGNVDYFLLSVPRSLGKLKTLRIWHDNTGEQPSWYLLRVMVHDVQSDVKTWFICDRWLAVEEDDGYVERLLNPASKEELTSFNLLFSTEARKNLTDGHLWFSVVTRPAKSNFTRVQRLSCCLSILLCTMLANAMFYQVGDESSTGTSVHVGPFSFSIKQLSIGITSSLVVLPVNILIVTFFRKARPAEAKTGLDKDQDPHGQSTKYEVSGVKPKEKSKEPEAPNADDDKKKDKKKKKKTLPHYFVYISYGLVFISCTVSATFTVFYGLTFGKEKSAGWLSSMMISFWQDVLISQPLKVFAAAMFFAVVIKDPNKAEEESEQEGNELNPDEEVLHDKAKNSEEEKALRKVGFVDKPPNPEKLEAARQLKLKQKAMKTIIQEVLQYIFFLGVLLVIAYGSRDPMSFSVTAAMRSVFEEGKYTGLDAFDEVSDFGSYWKWVQTSFVPSLMPRYWYGPIDVDDSDLVNEESTSHETTRMKNKKVAKVKTTGSKYSDASTLVLFEYENGFVADHSTALLVGTARLRQLRVVRSKCKLLPVLRTLFDECNVPYDWDNEDSGLYEPHWVPMPSNVSSEDVDPTPWTYQTQWKLKGTPYWGRFATYWGGGYVADFGADRKGAEKLSKELTSQHWIDRYTRAIFAEFTIYNAQTNFFCVITLLSEILPTGGYYHSPKIQTIRLYRYVGPEMVFVMACEISYMLFLLYFLYKQVRKYRKERREYFKDPWNYPELLVLGFSLSAVGLYFARLAITKYSISNMTDTPGKYVSFQYVAFIDEWVSATTAMAVFFSVLKFLRLLKFNRRVSLLMLTIKVASKPLLSFMLMFFILFLAYCQFAFVVFGTDNSDYASFPATLGSMMSMTLGNFDFDALTSTSRILGPIFFFSYVVAVLFVLMNVFIGILNDALSDVANDVSKQSNDHEILDFMLHTFKRTVGKQVGPAIKPNYKEPKNQFELNLDSIEELSDNVQYAMRNLCMEDIRQTNWFEPENASKKKKILMMLVLETDEDFTENDICDSIPLFDDILGKSNEQELIRKLIYYREEKKLEEADSQADDDQSDKSSDDDDDASENDSDSGDDNVSVASGDSGATAQKHTLRFVRPAEETAETERRSARNRNEIKLNASGTSEV